MSLSDTADQLVDHATNGREYLLGFGESMVRFRPSADRWTIAEVVGHMVDSASNNHQRFIRAQENEELVFPKYAQNSWVEKNHYDSAPWESLVELWYHYNLQLARVIREISPDQLQTQCVIGEFEPCTLEWLATDYVEHLVHHMDKIKERVND